MYSAAVFPVKTINQQQISTLQALQYQQLLNSRSQQRSIFKTRRFSAFVTTIVVLIALVFLVSFSSTAKEVTNDRNVTDTERIITSFAATSTKIIKTHTSTEENFTEAPVHNTNANTIDMVTEKDSSQNPTVDTIVVESSTGEDFTQNTSDGQ